jgi:hypothetical protein
MKIEALSTPEVRTFCLLMPLVLCASLLNMFVRPKLSATPIL